MPHVRGNVQDQVDRGAVFFAILFVGCAGADSPLAKIVSVACLLVTIIFAMALVNKIQRDRQYRYLASLPTEPLYPYEEDTSTASAYFGPPLDFDNE